MAMSRFTEVTMLFGAMDTCVLSSDTNVRGANRMEPFTTLTGMVIPLDRTNVNTDEITPARFLKTIKRTGFADALFANWRFRNDGTPDPDFVLNQSRYQGASILLVGDNFGCGSSRE